jgi:peptidase C39-like protein
LTGRIANTDNAIEMRIRLTLILAAVLAAAVALPGPGAAAALLDASGGDTIVFEAPVQPVQPAPQPAPQVDTSNWAGSYSVYRPRTHSVQKTDWYCVPASIQMMLNLIKGRSDRSKANQTIYWRYAQDHSRYPITDNGADAAGWAAALNHWGAGNYTVGTASSMQQSLRNAAKRMRATGKPVGLIVWGRNGGHAWVMTGFASNADPNAAPGTTFYDVTTIQAMGPLWPYGTIGGKAFDPGPKEWVSYSELRNKYTVYVAHNSPAWDGRWITVLP